MLNLCPLRSVEEVEIARSKVQQGLTNTVILAKALVSGGKYMLSILY